MGTEQAEVVPKFQVATACFSCSPLDLNSSKLSSLAVKATKITFSKLCSSPLIQKIKIPRPLSQATASNHPNAFTFTLLLSEGRASEAWEPSNKRCSFSLLTIKCVSLFPGLSLSSSLLLYFLPLSLSHTHTVYLYVPYGSHNKQRLFPQTALTGWVL
jgi:hypothetical protein